jgi:hypothetical protein
MHLAQPARLRRQARRQRKKAPILRNRRIVIAHLTAEIQRCIHA